VCIPLSDFGKRLPVIGDNGWIEMNKKCRIKKIGVLTMVTGYNSADSLRNKNAQTRLKEFSNRYCIAIIMVFIIIGGSVYPVVADKGDVYHDGGLFTEDMKNKHPVYAPGVLQKMTESSNSVIAIKQNWANLTPAEQKTTPTLLYLISLQKTSNNLSDEYLVQQMMSANLLKTATSQGEMTTGKSPDLIFLDIKMKPNNSTHSIDPYIYKLNGRAEDWGAITTWVKISDLMHIANLSGVGSIRTVTYGLFNIGTVEIQGNTTLHS
jgi:hypothetical protein